MSPTNSALPCSSGMSSGRGIERPTYPVRGARSVAGGASVLLLGFIACIVRSMASEATPLEQSTKSAANFLIRHSVLRLDDDRSEARGAARQRGSDDWHGRAPYEPRRLPAR